LCNIRFNRQRFIPGIFFQHPEKTNKSNIREKVAWNVLYPVKYAFLAGTTKNGAARDMKEKNKILLVDDEADMQVYISRLLETVDIKPVIATNTHEGLEKARDINPSVIILDITKPGEQGVKMYCTLKQEQKLKAIPVIMLSNIDKKTFIHYQRIHCAQLGRHVAEPDAYLEKPPEAEKLIGMVQFFMAKAGGDKKNMSVTANGSKTKGMI
jgi:CheY-like chemotaxis protein